MAEGLSVMMLMKHKDAQGCILGQEREADPRQEVSYVGDFFGTTPSYSAIRDLILRLCHRLIACSIAGRSQAPEKERLRGLPVIALELPIIDMAELVRLQIHMEIDDTWAWVSIGPTRQPDAAAGVPRVAHDAPIINEGVQAVLTPVQAPPPLQPPAARTMPQRMASIKPGRPREINIDEYWWRIYKSGDLEVLES
ncbi:hypothetical protein Tco_1047685 [Tanacetum coccineum]